MRTQASVDAAKKAMSLEILADKVEQCAGHRRRNTRHTFEMNTPPCAKSILRWARDYEFGGLAALQDDCAASGNRLSRLLPEETELLFKIVRGYADPSRPSKKRIVENVDTGFREANVERVRNGLVPPRIPKRDAVLSAIAGLDPFETDIQRLGLDGALKKHASTGVGLVVELPLERVEMDEWKADLMTMLGEFSLLEKITPEMWAQMETGRCYLSAALDVATRSFLSMRLSRSASGDSAVLVPRLLHASSYTFGLSFEYAIDAIEEALYAGDGTLRIEHFAYAYAAATGALPHMNPFRVDEWASVPVPKPVPKDEKVDDDVAPPKKTRRRK